MPHGKGSENWFENNSAEYFYRGEYSKGKKQGKGFYKSPDGSKYNGTFRDDQITG